MRYHDPQYWSGQSASHRCLCEIWQCGGFFNDPDLQSTKLEHSFLSCGKWDVVLSGFQLEWTRFYPLLRKWMFRWLECAYSTAEVNQVHPFTIGRHPDISKSSNMRIDELRVWYQPLTADDVWTIYVKTWDFRTDKIKTTQSKHKT